MSTLNTIESFIKHYRARFDTADPPAWLWLSLEKAAARLPQADSLEKFLLIERASFDLATPPSALWPRIEQAMEQMNLVKCDPLEAFIRNHRDDFDGFAPAPDIWEAIAAQPTSPKVLKIHWQRHLLRVAAALALLLAGMGLGIWYGQPATLPGSRNDGMALAEVSPEYAELEQYYQRDIAGKQLQLARFSANGHTDVETDLQQLDQVMHELRRDLAGVPPGNREQVIRAMIENYQAKSAILQRVLEHLNPSPSSPAETTNSDKHETEKI